MQLLKVELENYRQFSNKSSIDFSVDNIKNLVVIKGNNGAGKTNLVNAIHWCLYGKELYKTKIVDPLDLVNYHKIYSNHKVKVKVGLYFGHKKTKYYLERSMLIEKENNKPFIKEMEWQIKEFDKNIPITKGDWKNLNKFNNIRQKIISDNISNYFFIVGEKIDFLLKKGMENELKKLIHAVCDVDTLTKAKNNLSRILRSFEKTSVGDKKEIRYLDSEVEQSIDNKNELLISIKGNNKKIVELNNKKEQIDNILNELSIDPIKLENKIHKIKLNKSSYINQKNEITNFFGEFLFKNCKYISCSDAFNYTLEAIYSKSKNAELPPGLSINFLESLLEQNECICGTKLKKDEKERKNLESLIKALSYEQNLYYNFNEGRYIIEEIISDNSKFEKILEKTLNDLTFFDKVIKEFDYELGILSNTLIDLPINDLLDLKSLREGTENEIRNLISKKSEKELEIRLINEKLEHQRKELMQYIDEEEKLQKIARKMSFLRESIRIINIICENITKSQKSIIENEVFRIFNNFSWKSQSYQNLLINENYQIKLIDNNEVDNLPNLSFNERYLLSLALNLYLINQLKTEFPLFIDSPFIRLSNDSFNRVINSLMDLFENRQIILLISDREEFNLNYSKLDVRINRMYLLDNNQIKLVEVLK